MVSIIVAATDDNIIGQGNQLLWHLPNDLKFFKNTTWGMPVIMGRKTYQSIAAEPLPGRINIVVTKSNTITHIENKLWIANTIEAAIELAKKTNCKEIFIAGGGEIYKQSLPLANKIYITRVHTQLQGDVYFPAVEWNEWNQVYQLDFFKDEKHAYDYSFQIWVRKQP